MEISAQEFHKKIQNKEDLFLLDVRTKEEYEEDNISNTILIPIKVLDTKLNEIPKNKLIITICAHGNRSLRAAQFLNAHGYKALSLEGGMEAWNNLIINEAAS
ncbi:rhodanese-like domain-containing protein [Candidatus Woesearchaeota archaeon]|nr:rhodanese-like domain-containing protein [Candidatus Woesearchaeota archaeon]